MAPLPSTSTSGVSSRGQVRRRAKGGDGDGEGGGGGGDDEQIPLQPGIYTISQKTGSKKIFLARKGDGILVLPAKDVDKTHINWILKPCDSPTYRIIPTSDKLRSVVTPAKAKTGVGLKIGNEFQWEEFSFQASEGDPKSFSITCYGTVPDTEGGEDKEAEYGFALKGTKVVLMPFDDKAPEQVWEVVKVS